MDQDTRETLLKAKEDILNKGKVGLPDLGKILLLVIDDMLKKDEEIATP